MAHLKEVINFQNKTFSGKNKKIELYLITFNTVIILVIRSEMWREIFVFLNTAFQNTTVGDFSKHYCTYLSYQYPVNSFTGEN